MHYVLLKYTFSLNCWCQIYVPDNTFFALGTDGAKMDGKDKGSLRPP